MQKKLFDDRTPAEKRQVAAREKVLKRRLRPDEEKKLLKRARQGDPWAGNRYYTGCPSVCPEKKYKNTERGISKNG